ncbi:MAG: hypothetical protein sGL2_10620 [Candidatus Mesenet longicola]|nr:MAG: hypothetical protein sGL2_10620 [Candidatus Mesenet longicola]
MHIEEIYNHKISAATISSITDKLLSVINEWRICKPFIQYGWNVFQD